MKFLLPLFSAALAVSAASAGDYPRVLFSDDFSTNAFGPRWGHYKSASVIRDGVLVGITPEKSDHSAVDSIKFEGERDLEISVRFRFVSEQAKSFGVWFDDKDFKGSHAGHVVNVRVSPKELTLTDGKEGMFRNDLHEKKDAPGGLSTQDKEYLKTRIKIVPNAVSLKEWHTLVAHTKGDEVEALIDGKVVGSFKSPGIAHETKSLVSLTTNTSDIEYDDFSLRGVAK